MKIIPVTQNFQIEHFFTLHTFTITYNLHNLQLHTLQLHTIYIHLQWQKSSCKVYRFELTHTEKKEMEENSIQGSKFFQCQQDYINFSSIK